jgi:hypothetical protein
MKADQEATEAYLEKMETNPEEIKSVAEYEEIPKEDAAVKHDNIEEAAWGPESSCRASPKAKEKDPGQYWVQEDVFHCL